MVALDPQLRSLQRLLRLEHLQAVGMSKRAKNIHSSPTKIPLAAPIQKDAAIGAVEPYTPVEYAI